MTERVGLDLCHLAQVVVKTRHSDNIQYLCGFQALFSFPICCLRRPPMTPFDHEKGIIGITLMAENKGFSASLKTSSMPPKNSERWREGVSHYFIRPAVSLAKRTVSGRAPERARLYRSPTTSG